MEHLRSIATRREFHDGETLFRRGAEAHELLVIESGQVQLEFPVEVLGQERTVAFAIQERGAVVGWSALGRVDAFTLTARTIGFVQAIALPQAGVEAVFELYPDFGVRLLRNALSIVHRRLEKTHLLWTREIQRSVDGRYR